MSHLCTVNITKSDFSSRSFFSNAIVENTRRQYKSLASLKLSQSFSKITIFKGIKIINRNAIQEMLLMIEPENKWIGECNYSNNTKTKEANN